MGYGREDGSISARLSRHNSPHDTHDQRRWNQLVAKLRALEAEYQDIHLTINVGEVPVIEYHDHDCPATNSAPGPCNCETSQWAAPDGSHRTQPVPRPS